MAISARLASTGTKARIDVVATRATIGGGSLPGETLPSVALRVRHGSASGLAERLRRSDPCVIGRIEDGAVLLDLRTVDPLTDEALVSAVAKAISSADADRTGMTRVIGTAGHIDHGKTTLLRALTGIDADRLPEERRRGLTIDVGYAHLVTATGDLLDFVDVPGHDRLVGNMLVGAGEVDGCLLVVAADDGPRAQTLEHLALLDALALREGVAVVTKADLADADRVAEVEAAVRDQLDATTLRDIPVLAVSATSGAGLDRLASELASIAARPAARCLTDGPARLAIDRVFSIRGRGVVVTGSARGAPIEVGQRLRVLPGSGEVRVRGMEVHDEPVDRGPSGGRVALLVGGDAVDRLRRGLVLVAPEGALGAFDTVATRRLLVALSPPSSAARDHGEDVWPPVRDLEARLHIGTDQADALVIGRGRHVTQLDDSGAMTTTVKLDREVAARAGDRFVLRRPPPAGLLAGGIVIDPSAAVLAGAPPRDARAARTPHRRRRDGRRGGRDHCPPRPARHGANVGPGRGRVGAGGGRRSRRGRPSRRGGGGLAPRRRARRARDGADRRPGPRRREPAPARRCDGLQTRPTGPTPILATLIASGSLRRDGDVVAVAGHRPAAPDPARAAAMERLVAALDVAAPPSLREAAVTAGCSAEAIRELEREGRIVVVDDDLAWSRPAWERLRDQAVGLARSGPLTPAALRDASGTSRKYVMALLEDLQRRGILTRTVAGHVPGPRS